MWAEIYHLSWPRFAMEGEGCLSLPTSKHAVETLAAKQRLVPECLPCHSEQYRRTGKFVAGWGQADGVQCSTCHGEGVVHSLLERKDQIVRDPGEGLCVRCHDTAHDESFDLARDRERVKHWD